LSAVRGQKNRALCRPFFKTFKTARGRVRISFTSLSIISLKYYLADSMV